MIRAINNNVVVKLLDKDDEVSKSGIITPAATVEDKKYGEVVSIGELVEGINIGELAMFNPFAGTPIKDGKDKYMILSSDDILAIVEE